MESVSLVSISCLTYNHAPFLRECFDSFLAQKTNFDIEVLVHDDASTDGTQEIIQEYTSRFPAIFKPIIQKENQYSQGVRGIAVRFNFTRSKGKYIATCEGDDYWTDPLKLQKQVDFLEANPNYSMCCTNYSEINGAGEIIKERGLDSSKTTKTITQEIIFKKYKPKF
jgi:glycosyltransferase involved in cell wall biosynthesis